MTDLPDALLTALGEVITADATADPSPQETAVRLVQLAKEYLACDQAGISTCGSEGTLVTLASTHPAIEQADRIQHAFDQGPGLQSLVDEVDQVVGDLTTDRRWPSWGPAAAHLGLHTFIVVRMDLANRHRAVLSLGSSARRQVTREDLKRAQSFAKQAGAALLVAEQVHNLRCAVSTRTQIGQAQGVLMERFDLDVEQAIAVLKRYSQDSNRKLHTIAAEIVESRVLPSSSTVQPVERAPRQRRSFPTAVREAKAG